MLLMIVKTRRRIQATLLCTLLLARSDMVSAAPDPGLMLPGAHPLESGHAQIGVGSKFFFEESVRELDTPGLDWLYIEMLELRAAYALLPRVTCSVAMSGFWLEIHKYEDPLHDHALETSLHIWYPQNMVMWLGLNMVNWGSFHASLYGMAALEFEDLGRFYSLGAGLAVEGDLAMFRGDLSVPVPLYLSDTILLEPYIRGYTWLPEGGITWKLPTRKPIGLRVGLFRTWPAIGLSATRGPWSGKVDFASDVFLQDSDFVRYSILRFRVERYF